MKYIMFKQVIGTGDDPTVRHIPVLFPNQMTHALMRDACLTSPEFENAVIVSAGEFSSLNLRDIECHGSSSTLGVDSRGKEDTDIIKNYDYFHGLVD